MLPNDKISTYDDLEKLNAQWYYYEKDGTKTEIDLPASVDAKENEIVVFECVLPELADNKTLAFRSTKQEVEIFIDGKLRESHKQESEKLFTDKNISAYLYIPVSSEDSNKKLTINTISNSKYTGVLKTIYYGDTLDIIIQLSREDIMTIISAFAALFIGIIFVIVSFLIKHKLKFKINLFHLAFGTILVCVWIIAQSSSRQLYVPNIAIARIITYWSLILIPIPFSLYTNQIQKNRYAIAHAISIIITLIVFVILNLIWIFTDIDFFELILVMWFAIGFTAMTIIITSIYDFVKGLAKDYTVVLIGFIGLTIATFYQMYIYRNKTTVFSGLILSVGLVFLLLTAGIKTFKDYGEFISEKNVLQQRIEEKDYKIEKMSTQILHSLAQAIDAKDTYTNGHSLRVAQYSLLLAKKLELTKQMQSIIYYTALLHDIGKIGIPDQILQKQGVLTDEEYDIIKNHTTIGYEILKHIEEIPEIELGARWHHERYAGDGYPDNLKGDQIPLNARIIAVADAYDAMSSSRVYRKSLSDEYIRLEIEKGLGTQFDPVIGRQMLKLIDDGETLAVRNSTI